jgi:hypothetical protein
MKNASYTAAELQGSKQAAIGFDQVLRELKDGTAISFTGEKRTFPRNGNTVLIAKAEGRSGPVWLSVQLVDQFLGSYAVKDGDNTTIPEGLKVVVDSGRLAVAQA